MNVTADPSRVPYNSSVSLVCVATSFTEVNIIWSTTAPSITLPDHTLDKSEGGVVYIYTSTLQLSQVTTDYSGDYSCSVNNTAGTRNDTVTVEVFGKIYNHSCTSIQ